MKVILYYPKQNIINEVNDKNILDEMYDKLAMIPTSDQLKNYDKLSDNYIEELKDYISTLSYKIPLFDYATKNIYLTNPDDVYIKVTTFNYRFPDHKIIELLTKTIDDLKKIDSKHIAWVDDYIEKINKNINFMSNFNLQILKETYTTVFLNTNPTSRELTSCVKPSYLPYQDYQCPYYTKSELISLALNLGLMKDRKIKPWSFKDSELRKLCKSISKYEINAQMLIYNQLYILYNNAKAYVQYYSLFGSYYFNSYLRNIRSSIDIDLNSHIDNLLKIIKNTPPFESEYEVYRFIENDDYLNHLKIGDIFEELSFISTTRNPFYSVKENLFGFILLKIKLKKDMPGIALLMESYSNYPHEQEILIPPSRLKLISIDTDFNYYHWNKLAEKKIIKKYIFEYIEPIGYDITSYTKNYITDNIFIPNIDFYKQEYQGSTISEKTLNFFSSLPKLNLRRMFLSNIGKNEYKFYAYFLTQNKVYSKFFFLQKEDEQNRTLGDEIYLTIQNPHNGQIELLIEIRNIISVNYYHRFSGLENTIPDNTLIHWLSGLAKALTINTIIIHGNYSSYAHIVENILNKSDINEKNILDDFKIIQNIDNPDVNILNLYTADINTYCVDLVEYIYEGKKRFFNMSYIERKVPLHMIDKLKQIKFDDLYKSYKEKLTGFEYLYKIFTKLNEPNMTTMDFYKIIHNQYPYLVRKLQNLVIISYPKTSILPWHFYYVLKPYEYLFEKKIIPFIPATNLDKVDDIVKNLQLEVKFIHENKFRQIH